MFLILVQGCLVPIWEAGKMMVWNGTLSLPMNCTSSTSSGFCHHSCIQKSGRFCVHTVNLPHHTWPFKIFSTEAECPLTKDFEDYAGHRSCNIGSGLKISIFLTNNVANFPVVCKPFSTYNPHFPRSWACGLLDTWILTYFLGASYLRDAALADKDETATFQCSV